MQITIVKIGHIETKPGGKGTYKSVEILYRNEAGEVKTKKLVSFKNPSVFKALTAAKEDDVFDVTDVKDEDGYWQWTAAQQLTGETTLKTEGAVKEVTAKVGAYGAARDRQIVRQSSFERAIEYASFSTPRGASTFPTLAEVMEYAAQIEAWVFRAEPEAAKPAAPAPVKKGPGRPKKVVVVEEEQDVDSGDDGPSDSEVE